MFEKASRIKLRFSYKGQCTVEDLWSLSATQLDSIYKTLRAQQKEQEGDSLLARRTGVSVLALQIDIIKHIVNVKLIEADAKQAATKKKEQKERIMEILADKENESLKGKTEDELKALLANM